MPGVANSTMKCPNLGVLTPAMAFRPCSANASSLTSVSWLSGRLPQAAEPSQTRSYSMADLAATNGADCASNAAIMRRVLVRLEGRAVVIDFVEQDAVRLARRLQHVETAAARLVARRGAGIRVDEAAEGRPRAGLQAEIDDDHEAAHCRRPTISM